jgi:glycosyltransferase involved in cell wall biosynthesis
MTSVLHVTDSTEFGGAEQALLTLLTETDRPRWSLTLAYHPSEQLAPLVEGARRLGVTLWPVPRMDPGFEGLRRLPAFARELRRRSPDIVHLHLIWPLACQYPLLATAIAHRPRVVATAHSYVDLNLSWRVDRQQRLYTRAVDRYIAVSEHVKTQLIEGLAWPSSKLDVIHNGVDTTRFSEPARPELRATLSGGNPGPLVLVVARLDPDKGHRHLLAAAALLPDVRFVLAGEGPERGALEALASELRLDERVRFLGHRSDIPQLLAACDVMALPSSFEGLPISVLEAMASGTAVVASNIGGVDELVHHNVTGLLVEPRDAPALAGAIRRLVDDPALAARLADAARENVAQEFSASTMARRVAAVYDRVLERQRRPSVA